MLSLHFIVPYCTVLFGYERITYGIIGLVTSFIGLMASIKQLQVWYPYLHAHNERRKPSSHPHIVFCLAIGNALACLGSALLCLSMLLSGQSWWNSLSIKSGWVFPFEILSCFGYVASCFFTFVYLLDVHCQVCKINSASVRHFVFCWLLCVLITTAFQLTKYMHGFTGLCTGTHQTRPLVFVWFTVLLVFSILDIVVLLLLDRQIKTDVFVMRNTFSAPQRHILLKIRMKFAFIVFVFILCWLPTILISAVYLIDQSSASVTRLSFPEIVLNPLQGLFNYFIFIPRHASLMPANHHEVGIQNVEASYGSSLTADSFLPTHPLTRSFHFTPSKVYFDGSFVNESLASSLMSHDDTWSFEESQTRTIVSF